MRTGCLLFLWLALTSRVAAQDPNCVGDHHEGCPVLVAKEMKRSDPGCKSHQEISHGTSSSLFKGTLSWQDGEKSGLIQEVHVFRECLDERGKVARSCPMQFDVDREGGFNQEIWVKSVDEAL